MKRILVTGADGFIGSHLVESLVTLGYDVRAFCYYNSFNHKGWLDYSPAPIKDNIEIFFGDIRDANCVNKAVQGCDIVFHLASLIAIPYSYDAPQSYVDTNVSGTLNVMQACLNNQVEQVIHTSTSEVYGSAQYVPIDEKHPLVGQSPYSASKIGADQIALSFYCSFNLPVATIRPFNTFGPRQSARAVIPTIITQLLAGKSEISLGNLDATRDFNYYKDTVAGMLSFIDKDNIAGETINIGSGFEISIREIAELIAEVVGCKLEIKIDNARIRPANSEVERLCAANSKAKTLLRWQPKYYGKEGLKNGLTETVNWLRENAHNNFYNPNKYIK